MLITGVKPTLSELEKFEESPEGIDLELSTTVTAKEEVGHSFATGDVVEVCEGELMHLQGKITTIEGNKITLIPKHEELQVIYLLIEIVYLSDFSIYLISILQFCIRGLDFTLK